MEESKLNIDELKRKAVRFRRKQGDGRLCENSRK